MGSTAAASGGRGAGHPAASEWQFGVPGIFDNARDGLVLVRFPEARVVLLNRAAREMLGLAPETDVGCSLQALFKAPEILARAVASSQEPVGEWPGHGQAPLRTHGGPRGERGGELDEVEVTFCRVDDVGLGGPLVLLVVRRGPIAELADLARRGAKAQRRVDELERKAKDLALFFSEAAHEFNTPLTVVLLQSKLLQSARGPLAPVQQKALARIDTNVHRLMLLSQDLMDLARADAGKLVLHSEDLDLADTVAREVRNFRDLAAEQGIRLAWKAPTGPVRVKGDAARLRQVVANLLGNALKFTPRGGRVDVEVGAAQGNAWVGVRDNGRGMAREDVERLFQPFVRIAAPELAKKPGTGLGLYLSKRIVEAHGGTAVASSPGPGKGMEFRIRMPLVHPPGTERTRSVRPGRRTQSTRRRPKAGAAPYAPTRRNLQENRQA